MKAQRTHRNKKREIEDAIFSNSPDPSLTSKTPYSEIINLQSTVGNQAVKGLLGGGVVQAKLKIGQPNDKYEQEADRVADRVMGMSAHQVQRQSIEKGKEETIQTKVDPGQTPHLSTGMASQIQGIRGSGQPLSPSTRTFFEPRFGRDFSKVRIHTDPKASDTARSINAKAFTIGKDIVFGAGQHQPQTTEGKRLLAHELVHVGQQNGGPGMIPKMALTAFSSSFGAETHHPQEPRTHNAEIVQRQTSSSTEIPKPSVHEFVKNPIAGSNIEPELQAYLDVLNIEIRRWERFRNGFEGTMPGKDVKSAADKLAKSKVLLRDYPEQENRWVMFKGRRVYARVRNPERELIMKYVRMQLGDRKLRLLQEMMSFNLLRGVLGHRLIPVEPEFIKHNYICTTELVEGKGHAIIGGGVLTRLIKIEYSNQFGMQYTANLRSYGGKVIAATGAGASVGTSGTQKGYVKNYPVFWKPEDFGGIYTSAIVSVEAAAEAGPVSLASVEGKVLDTITFHKNGIDLTFIFGLLSLSGSTVSPSIQFKKPKGVEFSLGAKTEIEFGIASITRQTKIKAPPIPDFELQFISWNEIKAKVYFGSQKAEMEAKQREGVEYVARKIKSWTKGREGFHIGIMVWGHASPIWRRPYGGKSLEEHNMILSKHRADHVEAELRELLKELGDGITIDTITMGADEALEEGADPQDNSQKYRRVDIEVFVEKAGSRATK